MLTSFTVTNFKNFENTITLNLKCAANYEFNSEIVKNGCITKGLILGINGSGKSNLALALFDIVLHLTDKQRSFDKYEMYLNLNSKKPIAEFEYHFEFDGVEIVYRYGKTSPLTLSYESVYIEGKEVLNYNFFLRKGYTNLAGAENLQLSSTLVTEADVLSRVKYVKSNAILQDTKENRAFIAFTSFVDNMLMFYSLDERRYQGFSVGVDSYTRGIIREGKTKEFEQFLREQGVDYSIEARASVSGEDKELFCRFKNGAVPFASVASTGTKSLALFYYWFIKMSKASFVYIDEYDAFYHFELAQKLVNLVKKLNDTQVLLSSHNTDLISNDLLRPDAYFKIYQNEIRSFDKSTEKELRRAHNLQKMYKAGSFDE